MPRSFHIPGVAFLLTAFLLLFLTSISLPYLTGLDFVRTTFASGSSSSPPAADAVKELRVSVQSPDRYYIYVQFFPEWGVGVGCTPLEIEI